MSSVFDIDHTKYNPCGYKSPPYNVFDKHVIYPFLLRHSEQLYEIYESTAPSSLRGVPNMITTCSVIARTCSLVILVMYQSMVSRTIAASLFYLGYYLDALDGFFGRKYDVCTTFGCYYDHSNDIITYLFFLVICWWNKMYVSVFLLLLLAVFSINQVLVEEEQFNNYTPFFYTCCQTLTFAKKYASKKYVKYFGTSTWIFLVGLSFLLN